VALTEKFFLLETNHNTSCERHVGVSQANHRDTRKLGLLLSDKSSEVEYERMEPLERKDRVCGNIPTRMLILMKILKKNTPFGQQAVEIQYLLATRAPAGRSIQGNLSCGT
jgi:hypothetical protein